MHKQERTALFVLDERFYYIMGGKMSLWRVEEGCCGWRGGLPHDLLETQ